MTDRTMEQTQANDYQLVRESHERLRLVVRVVATLVLTGVLTWVLAQWRVPVGVDRVNGGLAHRHSELAV